MYSELDVHNSLPLIMYKKRQMNTEINYVPFGDLVQNLTCNWLCMYTEPNKK